MRRQARRQHWSLQRPGRRRTQQMDSIRRPSSGCDVCGCVWVRNGLCGISCGGRLKSPFSTHASRSRPCSLRRPLNAAACYSADPCAAFKGKDKGHGDDALHASRLSLPKWGGGARRVSWGRVLWMGLLRVRRTRHDGFKNRTHPHWEGAWLAAGSSDRSRFRYDPLLLSTPGCDCGLVMSRSESQEMGGRRVRQ